MRSSIHGSTNNVKSNCNTKRKIGSKAFSFMMGIGLVHDVTMIGQFLFDSPTTSSGSIIEDSSSGGNISFMGRGEHVAGHSQEYWIKEAAKELERAGHKTTYYDTCLKRAKECAVKTAEKAAEAIVKK